MAGFPLPGGRLAGIKGFGYKREEGKHDFKGEVHYYVDTPPTPPRQLAYSLYLTKSWAVFETLI